MQKMHIATFTLSFSASTKIYCLNYLSSSSTHPQSETEMERRKNCPENDMVENVLIAALGK